MKYIIPFFLIFLNFNIYAQKMQFDNSNLFYQIYPIYNFKHAVVSLTFDDGSKNHFKYGIPILRKMNIPATFYLITSAIDSTTKVLIQEDNTGLFEFGSHTVTHQNLVNIGNAEAKKELANSSSCLKSCYGLQAGLTMSYPWGFYNKSLEQLVKQTYLAARTTYPGYNSTVNMDLYALRTKNFDSVTQATTANEWVDYAVLNHLWLVEMLHGIEKVGYSPIDTPILIKHLVYIKQHDEDIWCSTVSDVAKYIYESKKAKVTCESCNDTVFNIRIDDSLNDSIYNHQLSIQIKVPPTWDSITISNGEKVKIEYANNSKFVLFNALPDNKLLTIRPKVISAPEIYTGMHLVFLSANPFVDNIKFSLEFFEQTDIEITLCNLSGQIFIQQKENSVIGVTNMNFDTSGIGKGVYVLKVNDNRGGGIIKKLVKI